MGGSHAVASDSWGILIFSEVVDHVEKLEAILHCTCSSRHGGAKSSNESL